MSSTVAGGSPAVMRARAARTTMGDVLARSNGVGHGFDFLRLFLAVSVVGWHSVALMYGNDEVYHSSSLWLYKYSVLPCFFALSGFLITGSASRLRLRDFLTNRGLRIVPALAVDVLLSALVIGPLVTTEPLQVYFADKQFFMYFLNIFGYIHYELPGVFKNNIWKQVNASLWTVPYELICYVIMSLFMIAGFLRRPLILAFMLFAFFLTQFLYHETALFGVLPSWVNSAAAFAFKGGGNNLAGPGLIPFFIAGSLAYLIKDRIPYNAVGIVAALLVLIAMSIFGDRSWEHSSAFQALSCALLVYVTVFVGLSNVYTPTILRRNDLSYGIYLYGWPIQQCVLLYLGYKISWVTNLFITLPILIAFATCSWVGIERPCLRLRKHLSFLKKRVADAEQETAPHRQRPVGPDGTGAIQAGR